MAGTVLAVDAADRRTDPDVTSLIGALQKEVRVLRPAAVPEPLRPVFSRPAASVAATRTIATVEEAAAYLKAYAAALKASTADAYEGAVGPGELPRSPAVWVLTDAAGGKANISSLRTARTAGDLFGKSAFALIAAPRAAWPGLVGLARAHGSNAAYCLDTGKGTLSLQGMLGVLERMTRTAEGSLIVATSGWNNALAMTAGRSAHASIPVPLVLNCTGIEKDPAGHLAAAVPAYDGRLVRWDRIPDGTAFLSVADGAEMPEAAAGTDFTASAIDLQVLPEWTAPPLPEQAPSLSAAEVIIDVGYGIRDRSGFDLARELRKKLEDLGLAPLFGATRKVTQDLKLLPLDAQIGQTGVRVNPKLIIALGISGAPQHIDWIGSRAEVLCFNKDPEAPLMNLNDSRPAPRVHPIPGDLFVTVRELIAKL
jgi:electron transfer flavoprotein alpha subunit